MIPIFYIYAESYHDAKKLFKALYRPDMDKGTLITEELWEKGECFEVERDTEIWRIFKVRDSCEEREQGKCPFYAN